MRGKDGSEGVYLLLQPLRLWKTLVIESVLNGTRGFGCVVQPEHA